MHHFHRIPNHETIENQKFEKTESKIHLSSACNIIMHIGLLRGKVVVVSCTKEFFVVNRKFSQP